MEFASRSQEALPDVNHASNKRDLRIIFVDLHKPGKGYEGVKPRPNTFKKVNKLCYDKL
jgi:hypothetical protein